MSNMIQVTCAILITMLSINMHGGENTMESKEDKPVPEHIIKAAAGSFYLSESQRQELITQALNGSQEAAGKVYLYYAFCQSKHELEDKWMLFAAELGNLNARHNLKKITNDGIDKINLATSFVMSSEEKNHSKTQVLKGSGEAAFWLYLYYRFCEKNLQEAEKWRVVAVKLNVKIAERKLFNNYDKQDK
jgi:hypothetical protein